MPCEAQSYAVTSQGTSRLQSYRELEEARNDAPLQVSEGVWLCQQLDVRLLISSIVKQYTFLVLSCPVCGLWYFVIVDKPNKTAH